MQSISNCMQSKRQSLIETATSTSTGFVGSWLITAACFTYIPDKWAATTATTLLCTLWSLIRGYTVRRYFNKRNMAAA
ncbi:hypothetical protein D3C75_1060160 [compost metagenome]